MCVSQISVSSFPDTIAKKDYCSVELTEAKYKAFVYAIRNHYWYQMYIGEWCCGGDTESTLECISHVTYMYMYL